MTRNFNFLIDAFKNLSGEYKFGIFIHEDNWEIFYKDCYLTDGCCSCNEYYNPEPIRRSKNDNRN